MGVVLVLDLTKICVRESSQLFFHDKQSGLCYYKATKHVKTHTAITRSDC